MKEVEENPRGVIIIGGASHGKRAALKAAIEQAKAEGHHIVFVHKEPKTNDTSARLMTEEEVVYQIKRSTERIPEVIIKESPKSIFNKRNRKRHY